MDIDGVKITSWDPARNFVVEQNANRTVPRPFIRYQDAEGGIIQNSKLSHMGYHSASGTALSYVRGFSIIGNESANIEIRNNNIHHFWYAFFSNGAGNIVIDGNRYHHNHEYTL
jgi:hypothetical protein